SSLIFADNADGCGLWFSPVYKSHDSDDFDAQGVDYGADIDLYGAALGVDYTTSFGLRFGGFFNVGAGDADSKGVADDVSNDFDYFGVGLYGGMNFGKLGLSADLGYTQVDNDIDMSNHGYHGMADTSASTDTSAFTAGLRAEYKFELHALDITPHLGLRYTNLDMDNYSVKADKRYASTSADSMNVFSIPVGVTFSKEIAAGQWLVKPVFDLTVTANAGDTEIDTDTTFEGVEKLSLTTEVMDDFTYGGTLGIDAKYGQSVSFGVGVNYVGSSSADEFGVSGNIRFMF
ncbi:MAG: autotransporter outer membrane beta-barrel domain-containing protein, partial [Proteobacteria bacterium]|nr:autotransporter outer membrane beta-barrel domain-containing protein [Candidatus Avisuccinivibrio stercorigallinarum]